MTFSRMTSLVFGAALLAAPGLAHAQNSLIVAMPTTPPNIVHMPMHIANDLGLFKKYGLGDQGRGAGRRRLHLPRRWWPAAPMSLPPRARSRSSARAKGADTKMILANMPKLEASMVVNKDIKTMADLKGKRIGIQEPGGFADVLARGVLRAAKIDPKDVTSSASPPRTCLRWSPARSTPPCCMSSRRSSRSRRFRACTPSRGCGKSSPTTSTT